MGHHPDQEVTVVPARLVPLLAQYDHARRRLLARLLGPRLDSGDDEAVAVEPISDAEYRWEPARACLSLRQRSDGPGPAASALVGAGQWRRDARPQHAAVPPLTTIAWRLAHLSEQLAMRADHMTGTHTARIQTYEHHGDAAGGVQAFEQAATAWRRVLSGAEEGWLDEVGRSTYPYGSDPDVPFLQTVWWVNQELLHHGAEIALLRDLHRAHHAG